MRISRVDFLHLRIPRVTPVTTSYGTQCEAQKLLLRVYDENDYIYTECVAEPEPSYSYETAATASEILRTHLLPPLFQSSLEHPTDFRQLSRHVRGHPMAKAAIENAYWIFYALKEPKSLCATIGGKSKQIASGVTIGIQETPKKLVQLAENLVEKGYTRIKVKITPGSDVEFIRSLRNALPNTPISVDANAAYSYSDISTMEALDDLNLLMIEQPLAHDDLLEHAKLQKHLKTAICLDESIKSARQARAALEMKACAVVNIKQGRVGGLTTAKEIHDLCAEAGIGVFCGGMGETGVGRAVQVALAGLPNFVYPNDISASDHYFEHDIVGPPFKLNSNGTIDVPHGLGLGVDVDERTIDRFTVASAVFRP